MHQQDGSGWKLERNESMKRELVNITAERYQEYERQILLRDQLRKEAAGTWLLYMKTFGERMTESFRLKVECIRIKKEIGFIVQSVNAGKTLRMDEMEAHVQREMQEYQKKLDQLVQNAEDGLNAKISTEYTTRKVRKFYRSIARMIHPDMHPETADDAELMNLWQRTERAYAANDLREMEELYILAQKARGGEHVPGISFTVEELEKKIEELKKEIHLIRTTDPYCYIELLADENAVREKSEELQQEIDEYEGYRTQLEETKNQLLETSGLHIIWMMK